MIKRDKQKDNIELRSKKVSNLIGEIPPYLVRWGTALIVLIFLLLLMVLVFLPYPYSNGESIIQHFIE